MDWKKAKTGKSENNSYFAEVERKGVVIRQWGLTKIKAFDSLVETVKKLEKSK